MIEKRFKFGMVLPHGVMEMHKIFKKKNRHLFLVGGAIRDALLNITPKDFDLATDALPDEVEEMMEEIGLKTLPTGKAFGVINVFTDSGEFEVVTFRSDCGSGRRPNSVKFTTIEEDVKRRDLTCNALFFDIDTSEVIDLVGGLKDLENGVIRTVGKAEDRITEDRLRIMRAVRFAARFGSELEPELEQALSKDASLEGISSERIRDEFLKGVKSAKSVIHFLKLLAKFKLFCWIFPKLNINGDFIEEKNPIILISNLLKMNKPGIVNKVLAEMTFTVDKGDKEIPKIVFLLNFLKFNPNEIVQFKKSQTSSKISDDEIRRFGKLNSLSDKVVETFINFQLTVTGQEMIDKGIKAGPEMGLMIKKIEINNFLLKLK